MRFFRHESLPSRGETSELLRRFRGCTRGANAVEFAIICPLLFMLAIGILVYGLYFGTAHAVQQLAADAARASVAGLSDAERSSIAQKQIASSVGAYPFIFPEKLKIDAEPSSEDGELFVVRLEYDASDLPVFGLDKLVPVPSPTITRSASIRRGGY